MVGHRWWLAGTSVGQRGVRCRAEVKLRMCAHCNPLALLLEKLVHVCTRRHVQGRSEQKFGKRDFPGGAVVKDPPANAGDTGSSPGPGRSHMPQSN